MAGKSKGGKSKRGSSSGGGVGNAPKTKAPKRERNEISPSSSTYETHKSWLLAFVACSVAVAIAYFFQNETIVVEEDEMFDDTRIIDPPQLLSLSPRIYLARSMLSSTECDTIIRQALDQNTGTSSAVKGGERSEWRNSTTTLLRRDVKGSSPVITALLHRVANASNMSIATVRAGNPISVSTYQPGGYYLPHHDSRHLEDLYDSPVVKAYDQLKGFKVKGGYPYTARRLTALCYLNDDFTGGQTVFPLASRDDAQIVKDQPSKREALAMQNANQPKNRANWESLLPAMCAGTSKEGISVAPEKGTCVLFYNHLEEEDGRIRQLDRLTLHGGCSVQTGVKWIANVWVEVLPDDEARNEAKKEAAAAAVG